MTAGAFITGTGTGIGKTFLTRGLARALARRGRRVAAIKPLETGCTPNPLDALALARACGRPDLSTAPGLYRARLPLAPAAATMEGEPPPPSVTALTRTIAAIAGDAEITLVEGAGGLLVPLDPHHTMADLARALSLPLFLVARDGLGVLSHALTAWECATRRALSVAGLVLVSAGADPVDVSSRTNRRILEERLGDTPVLSFPSTPDDDNALADAADASGLTDLDRRIAALTAPRAGWVRVIARSCAANVRMNVPCAGRVTRTRRGPVTS